MACNARGLTSRLIVLFFELSPRGVTEEGPRTQNVKILIKYEVMGGRS